MGGRVVRVRALHRGAARECERHNLQLRPRVKPAGGRVPLLSQWIEFITVGHSNDRANITAKNICVQPDYSLPF